MRKRNKLYIVNKWNQPLFATEVDREHQNIFDGLDFSYLNNVDAGSLGSLNKTIDPSKITSSQMSSWLPKQVDVPVGKVGGAGKIGNVVGALGGVVGGAANKIISGGLSSGAGNAVSSIGNTVGGAIGTVNPLVGGIVSAASGIIGGGINALWGMKTDQKKLRAANEGTNYLNSFVSDASSFDDIQGPNAVANVQNAYKGGVFKKGKARRKNAALRAERANAESWANRSVDNNIDNIAETQMDNMLANYAAFGGPLGGMPIQDTGAIDYGFMSDYLVTKNRMADMKNKITGTVFDNIPSTPINTFESGGGIHIKKSHRGLFTKEAKAHGMGVQEFASHVLANKDKYSPEVVKRANFARNAAKFALGGDMQTNGADFTDGLTIIGAGGSHEENPYDGVQVGVSRENGQPNLVEEGETIFDDYVFSQRIKADAKTKKKFHIGKKTEISYADLSKKLEKESLERPNDPISQNGLKKQLHDLADEQERQKGEEMQDAFDQLPPEQQQAIMQQVAMQEQQTQETQQMQNEEQLQNAQQEEQLQGQQDNGEQMVEEPNMEEENTEQINACGGKMNRYDNGGDMKQTFYNLLSPYVEGGIHTDSDFDKWLEANKLSKITDWDNILDNKAFMKVVGAKNPALGDAISRGYDFKKYKAPTGKYNLEDFKREVGAYTKSKIQGNLPGNYAIDKDFNTGKYKNIKDLEESPNYKDYTKYGRDALKRVKGIAFKYKDDSEDYDNIEWKDAAKKFSKDDWDALRAIQYQIDGTAVNPNGEVVPLWNKIDKEGYSSIANNADSLFEHYRTDGNGGVFHFTPKAINRNKIVKNIVVDDNGKAEDIIGDVPEEWNGAGSYSWQDTDNDYTYNYYKRPVKTVVTPDKKGETEEKEYEPIHKSTWGRTAGLLGPVVGLGMQALGIGKPDYSGMDASLEIANGSPAMAHYKPIGNYLTYRPMDIWYEQNRMDANSRATDRAILNNASPMGTKMAGLLANGYNSQIADGELYRKALEYNDAQRQRVAEFNRGTDMYHANAANQVSATNAQIANNNRQLRAQMKMDAARQRMAADAAWNQGIYGNVNGLFAGLGAWGKENAQHNMIADMAADGLFGTMSDKQNIGKTYIRKKKAACGGKINRKKKGLTF